MNSFRRGGDSVGNHGTTVVAQIHQRANPGPVVAARVLFEGQRINTEHNLAQWPASGSERSARFAVEEVQLVWIERDLDAVAGPNVEIRAGADLDARSANVEGQELIGAQRLLDVHGRTNPRRAAWRSPVTVAADDD